ncbi:MAG TPA: hypothetical protein VMX58_02540 [Patescibacteria group bacterium]|nr:hypothetical protein [Patescibacteria group bacterium]
MKNERTSGIVCAAITLVILLLFSHDLYAEKRDYSITMLLDISSSDSSEGFLFGYGDYKTRTPYKGYSFWFSLPGPLFVSDQGYLYIYEGNGSALKKYDQKGDYVKTIPIPKSYSAELNFTGERIDSEGTVCIRSVENQVVTFSTTSDEVGLLPVPEGENAKAEVNRNGTIFVWTDDRNIKLKIDRNGNLLGPVDYDCEDAHGNAYDIVGTESRRASNKYFRKHIDVYTGNSDDRAISTSELKLAGTISPNEVAPDTRWRIIGFDADNNIYIEVLSKPDEKYDYGNPLVHVLAYNINGTLLENVEAMIPCTIHNAPAGRHVNINSDGDIYICGIQPETAWNITRRGDFGGTDWGNIEDFRFKVWKLER